MTVRLSRRVQHDELAYVPAIKAARRIHEGLAVRREQRMIEMLSINPWLKSAREHDEDRRAAGLGRSWFAGLFDWLLNRGRLP